MVLCEIVILCEKALFIFLFSMLFLKSFHCFSYFAHFLFQFEFLNFSPPGLGWGKGVCGLDKTLITSKWNMLLVSISKNILGLGIYRMIEMSYFCLWDLLYFKNSQLAVSNDMILIIFTNFSKIFLLSDLKFGFDEYLRNGIEKLKKLWFVEFSY